jgi:L-amino acid N-acyltransferase YncA
VSAEIASIIIRRARVSDAPAVGRVYVKTWRSTYAGLVPDRVLVGMSEVNQAGNWHRQIERKGDPIVMVAEADRDRIVAVGSAGPARGAGPDTGEVYTLYVDPDWHGRDVGRSLLGALFRELVAEGRNRAIVWVLAANPSRFFYEAVGGMRTVERIEKLWGTELPEIGYCWEDLAAAVAPDGPLGQDRTDR